jgi:hypothetical protein
LFPGGCKKEKKQTVFAPKLTAERHPPALRGLRLGQSTQAEIEKKFKNLKVHKDPRLGGKTKKVEYGGKPAVVLAVSYSGMKQKVKDGVHEARFFLTKAKDGKFRLASAQLVVPVEKGTSNFAFIKKKIGSHEKAKEMPGSNRSFRDYGENEVEYAAGTADGKRGVYVAAARLKRGGIAMERISLSIVFDGNSGQTIIY